MAWPGPVQKRDRFLTRGLLVHRDFLLQIFGGLLKGEFAEREFHVHFHAQRAQSHEIVNDLARVRTVIEQTGLQHHFFSVKADPFVRTRVVVMPPDRVLVFPRETKLKVMTGNSFVNGDRPRIHRGRAPEVAKFFRRLRNVTDAILI